MRHGRATPTQPPGQKQAAPLLARARAVVLVTRAARPPVVIAHARDVTATLAQQRGTSTAGQEETLWAGTFGKFGVASLVPGMIEMVWIGAGLWGHTATQPLTVRPVRLRGEVLVGLTGPLLEYRVAQTVAVVLGGAGGAVALGGAFVRPWTQLHGLRTRVPSLKDPVAFLIGRPVDELPPPWL